MNDIWQKIYDLYPINQELIWLNNCGTTSPSSDIVKQVSSYLEGFARRGVLSEVRSFPGTRESVKTVLSGLLGCGTDELALVHNTSEGMNLLSWGLRLKAGDRLLLLENEYPSNVYPWEHWQEKGVTIDFVPVGNHPAEFLENFKNRITKETKAVSFSAVHWCTGMPLPLYDIGKICLEHQLHFILDGAQGVGHIPVDAVKMNIAAMVFPAWKWLLGPLGLGVMYINRDFMQEIDFVFKGQSSVTDGDNYLPYKNSLKPDAGRYESSTPAFTEWVYFQESLQMLAATGFDRVRDRIIELADYLSEKLRENGYSVLSDRFPGTKTGIVVFEKKGVPSELIVKTLRQHNIIGALRLGRVRLAPHVYNSFEQIDTVIDVLKSVH